MGVDNLSVRQAGALGTGLFYEERFSNMYDMLGRLIVRVDVDPVNIDPARDRFAVVVAPAR